MAPGGPEVTLEEEEEPDVKSKPTPPPKPGSHTTEALKKTLAEREEEKALEGVPTDVRSMLKVCTHHTLHKKCTENLKGGSVVYVCNMLLATAHNKWCSDG